MAAERGIHVPNAKSIRQPGFFGTNSYSEFGRHLHYPATYEDFLWAYQEELKHKQQK
jgi:hypothetical protein